LTTTYTDVGGGLGDVDYRLDTNRYDGPVANNANNANSGPTPLVKPTVSQRQSSHEFQFNSRAESLNLEYLLGAYYFEESGIEDNSPLHLQLRTPIDAFSSIHVVNFVSQKYEVENETAAVFGQLSWTPRILDDKLRLTLGARHSRDWRYALKKQRDETYFEIPMEFDNTRVFSPATLSELPILGPLLTPILYQAGLPGDRRFDNVAGKRRFKDSSVSGQFECQFSDDILFYGKVVEAYKSGGFNTRDPQLNGRQGEALGGIDYGVGFTEGFGSEKAKTAELGIRSEWLNGRLRVNADIYRTDFDDMQMNFLLNGTVTDTKVLNAGKASIQGLEFDVSAMLGEKYCWQWNAPILMLRCASALAMM
jgi:iron complex outermembrane receptor protein